MTSKTAIPPQAYTRETLSQAFEWLKAQPQTIRDRATSADALVSLYLHSRRYGSPTLALIDESQPKLEDMISVENFKEDLKTLAQGLKEFEGPAIKSKLKKASKVSADTRPPTTQAPLPPHDPPPAPAETKGAHMHYSPPPSATMAPPTMPSATAPRSEAPPAAAALALDDRSNWFVRTTRERFNLGSDHEALRMLVAIGFDQLKESFPRGF